MMQKLVLSVTFIVMISMSPVFALEEMSSQRITLMTDKLAYNEGDVITITGNVEKVVAGLDVSLQIFFEKNLLEIAQVAVSKDGKFTKTFVASGPMWENEGSVIIKATYGKDTNTELGFKFFKETGTRYTSNYEVDIIDGGTFDVRYSMKGGVVNFMSVDTDDLSLNIEINTDTNGSLSLEIPRDAIDSIKKDGSDDKFIILIYKLNQENPVQTDFRLIETTSEIRSIYIPLKSGDSKIQIIGTQVIPEFGTIAVIILAVAITSIIVLSAKTKLSIMPKLWLFFIN